MIIVINGPFGVGKSVTAHLLVERLPGAIVYDPELIGFVLRRIGRPVIKVADYQDLTVWRGLTILGAWALRRMRRTLVVPMAVWRRDYFAQFITGLRRADPDVCSFRLTATQETLQRAPRHFDGFPTLLFVTTQTAAEDRIAEQAYRAWCVRATEPLRVLTTTTERIASNPERILGRIWRTHAAESPALDSNSRCWLP
jgi:hypothetical protein